MSKAVAEIDPIEEMTKVADRLAKEEEAAKCISFSRAKLVIGDPANRATSAFFASLALKLDPEVCWDVPTMATNGKQLMYNPDFTLGLTKTETVAVVAHEVLHCALDHLGRLLGRNPFNWNIACDLAENCILEDAGFKLPKGALFPERGPYAQLKRGLSADEYYHLLPPPPPGSDNTNCDPGGCGGMRQPGDGSPAAQANNSAEWKVAVCQAHEAAKKRGNLSAGLDRLVDSIMAPKVDWRAVLREFISRTAKNDYSWIRPNRRYIHQGLYLPGLHSEELGDVVVAVDTSGSIGQKELNAFAAEMQGILE